MPLRFYKKRSFQPQAPLPVRKSGLFVRRPPLMVVSAVDPGINGAGGAFTQNGVVRGIGAGGKCISANGSTRPTLSSGISVTGDRTIVLHVKSNALSAARIFFTSSSGAGVGYWIGQNSYAWSIGGVINGSVGSANQKDQVVVVTKAGTTHSLYIDGVLAASGTNSLADGTGSSFLTFGTTTGYDATTAYGQLYTGAVYDYAFTPEEVKIVSGNPSLIYADDVIDPYSVPVSSTPTLTVQDATHSHTADNVSLSVSGSTDLVVQDASHTHAADNIVLSVSAIYDITAATDYLTGQNIRVLTPNAYSANPYNAANPTPVIIYTHGAGETQTALTSDSLKATCLHALIDAGYILAESNAHGENWGNNAAINDYTALEQYVRANYNVSGVAIWSQSMGGLSGLSVVTHGQFRVLGWLGTYPVCNLADMHGGAYASAINTAYSVTGSGIYTYTNQTYGYDPALKTAHAFRDTPMRFYASSGDTVVDKAANSDTLAAIVAGSRSEAEVVVCSGDHGNASHFQPSDYVAFFDRCFAATSRTVSITLTSDGTTPVASATGLKWAFWENLYPGELLAPVAQGTVETTDGSGILSIPVTTRLGVGDVGWLVVTDSDGTTTQSPAHKAFSGPVVVS